MATWYDPQSWYSPGLTTRSVSTVPIDPFTGQPDLQAAVDAYAKREAVPYWAAEQAAAQMQGKKGSGYPAPIQPASGQNGFTDYMQAQSNEPPPPVEIKQPRPGYYRPSGPGNDAGFVDASSDYRLVPDLPKPKGKLPAIVYAQAQPVTPGGNLSIPAPKGMEEGTSIYATGYTPVPKRGQPTAAQVAIANQAPVMQGVDPFAPVPAGEDQMMAARSRNRTASVPPGIAPLPAPRPRFGLQFPAPTDWSVANTGMGTAPMLPFGAPSQEMVDGLGMMKNANAGGLMGALTRMFAPKQPMTFGGGGQVAAAQAVRPPVNTIYSSPTRYGTTTPARIVTNNARDLMLNGDPRSRDMGMNQGGAAAGSI